jgi:hypothetical protein
MSIDAEKLLAASLKHVKLNDAFFPAEIGAKLGFCEARSELAARELSNAGVFELSFDGAAQFTRDFCKAQAKKSAPAPARRASPRRKAAAAAGATTVA